MLAVLFPWATRKQLIGPHKDGRVTLQKIADMVALPVPYVQFVMSDEWDRVFDTMMGAERPRLPDKVHTLKADNSPIEIYSVPLGDNPYSYAKEIYRRKSEPAQQLISSFVIESEGKMRAISKMDILG